MIGNALPPPFIAAHSKNIRRVLQNSEVLINHEEVGQ
jgi:hypothetical protein